MDTLSLDQNLCIAELSRLTGHADLDNIVSTVNNLIRENERLNAKVNVLLEVFKITKG